jgi:leader peptidase (prepilin peptidase)/N-methyltransferase
LTPWLLPVLVAPFIGSFLGVLIRRLPMELPIGMARSRCESCGRPLGAIDLVPLLSYAAFGGRCRTCRAAIGLQHLAIEIGALVVAVWAALADAGPERVWSDCALGWTLLALAWIDWEHLCLPDTLTLPLLVLGLVVAWVEAPFGLTDHAMGALIGYLGFWLLAWLYRSARGREGLGLGDAKLLAAAGAWLGAAALPRVVLIAAACGIGVSLVGAWRHGRLDRTAAVPFGPCLGLATWLVRLHGA